MPRGTTENLPSVAMSMQMLMRNVINDVHNLIPDAAELLSYPPSILEVVDRPSCMFAVRRLPRSLSPLLMKLIVASIAARLCNLVARQ